MNVERPCTSNSAFRRSSHLLEVRARRRQHLSDDLDRRRRLLHRGPSSTTLPAEDEGLVARRVLCWGGAVVAANFLCSVGVARKAQALLALARRLAPHVAALRRRLRQRRMRRAVAAALAATLARPTPAALRRLGAFAGWKDRPLGAAAAAMAPVALPGGAGVLARGEAHGALRIVAEGTLTVRGEGGVEGVVGPQEAVDEAAFLAQSTSEVDVVVGKGCARLWTLSYEEYQRVWERFGGGRGSPHPGNTLAARIAALRVRRPLTVEVWRSLRFGGVGGVFAEWPEGALREFTARAQPVAYHPGESLTLKLRAAVVVVASGTVTVTLPRPPWGEIGGKSAEGGAESGGEALWGAWALLGGAHVAPAPYAHPTRATAHGPVDAWVISADDVAHVVRAHSLASAQANAAARLTAAAFAAWPRAIAAALPPKAKGSEEGSERKSAGRERRGEGWDIEKGDYRALSEGQSFAVPFGKCLLVLSGACVVNRKAGRVQLEVGQAVEGSAETTISALEESCVVVIGCF